MKRMFLLVLAMLLTLTLSLAEESMLDTVVYEGAATVPGAWQLTASANTTNASGKFDPSLITEGGYFTVTYEGTENGVYLALSDWNKGLWAQSDAPASCSMENGRYVAVFTFEQCMSAYGDRDMSAVNQICVGSANAEGPTTVYNITWHGQPPVDDLGADAVLFKGSAVSSGSNSNLWFLFTKHVGGDFDAAQINPGSRVYVEYTGAKNGVYLALSSHSGATQWARVNASEVVDLGEGRYASWFDYASMVNSWGRNFARLDQFTVFASTNQEVTLKRVAYYAGEGAATDTSSGRWDRPDTGIAFIGDSICQNALLMYGDWNTILDRSDCVNYGIGGQTSVECLARIDELASRSYKQVVFICGINDIGRGRTADEILTNYSAMISAIQANQPECQFLIVSVLPTTSAFYAGQQQKIVALNAAYEQYAAQHANVEFANVYPDFCAGEGQYAYAELLTDGLHPNADGYDKMAAAIKPFLLP